MNTLPKIVMLVFGILAVLAFPVFSAEPGGAARGSAPDNAPRSIAPYFTPATSSPKAPDTDGLLQRWLRPKTPSLWRFPLLAASPNNCGASTS